MDGPVALRLDAVNAASGCFDDVIDVRAPSEYAEDHLPGAINLPVLNDAERAQVGTIYKQISPFDARKVGSALVVANIASHISGPLKSKTGGWHPVVYCWRGGQRSGAMATILSQVGWRVAQVEGGYKSWRSLVIERVQNRGFSAPVIVIDGNTGSAKTAILKRLALRGHQVIDFEGIANHRGSLFGAVGPQPSQKMFEGYLASAIESLDTTRPVLVEAESSRIGNRTIPKAIWAGMACAPRLTIEVPLQVRATYLARNYADVRADKDRIQQTIRAMSAQHSAEQIKHWLNLVDSHNWTDLAQGLMSAHYDPRYIKHRSRYAELERGRVVLEDLSDLDHATGQVETVLASLGQA